MSACNWLRCSGSLITSTELNAPSFALPAKIYLQAGKDPIPEWGLYPEFLILFMEK